MDSVRPKASQQLFLKKHTTTRLIFSRRYFTNYIGGRSFKNKYDEKELDHRIQEALRGDIIDLDQPKIFRL